MSELSRTSKTIANKYALALYQLAEEKNRVNIVYDHIRLVTELVRENEQFKNFLSNPILKSDEQEKIIRIISDRLNLDAMVTNFMCFMSKNRRLYIFSLIYDQLGNIINKVQGKLEATVVSAIELDAKALKEIQETLENREGKKVNLIKKVDPNIIGGLIIFIGSKLFDNSIKGKMNRLEFNMKEIN